MALRRLLSGWLIALAALARSVAQALERASEERSTPLDPVMAALAERYPGAPAHWLAHVAERTSQLAETGEAPLSLNSDPSAWPPAGSDGAPPRVAAPTAIEPAEHAFRPRDPLPARPPSRRETAVPALAALRERSSEVWRRPDVSPSGPRRPVFALSASVPAPERPTYPASASEVGAPAPRRPRSPLSVNLRSPGPTPPAAVSSTTPEAGPTVQETVWSQAPRPRAETPGVAKAPPVPQRSMERPSSDRPFVAAGTKQEPKTPSDPAERAPAVRQRGPWFFGLPTRAARAVTSRTESVRRALFARNVWAPAKAAIASEPASIATAAKASTPLHTVTSDQSASAPVQAPDAARRPLFRPLATPGARLRSDRRRGTDPAGAKTAPSIDWLPTGSGLESRAPAPGFGPLRTLSSDRAASIVSPSNGNEPSLSNESHAPQRMARHKGHGASAERIAPTVDGERHLARRAPSFAARRLPAPHDVSRRFADSQTDARWPTLPPSPFAPPSAVEVPSPRWEQLAREQEEGRWNV